MECEGIRKTIAENNSGVFTILFRIEEIKDGISFNKTGRESLNFRYSAYNGVVI